jgi:hypothetical protein
MYIYISVERHMLEKLKGYPRLAEPQPVLERIAETLDCSVSDFSEPTSNNLNQTAELLCMWLMIKNEQDRLKVLACMRSIVPAVGAQQGRWGSKLFAFSGASVSTSSDQPHWFNNPHNRDVALLSVPCALAYFQWLSISTAGMKPNTLDFLGASEMPRFFFNLRHRPGPAGLAVDPEGEDFPDLNAARERALNAARDHIARTRSDTIRDWFNCSFEIEDQDAQLVLTVPFSDAPWSAVR